MPLVLRSWLVTLTRNRDRSGNVMIVDGDVHMAAKVVALDDPAQVRSLQLTISKRSDGAQSYHHEVAQRVQAGVNQTRLAQCELWIQFGMPTRFKDEKVWYAHLEASTAEVASQKAHAEVAEEDLQEPENDDYDALLQPHVRRSPRKSTRVRAFQAGEGDED